MQDILIYTGFVALVILLTLAFLGIPVAIGIFCRKCFNHSHVDLVAFLATTISLFFKEKASSRYETSIQEFSRQLTEIISRPKTPVATQSEAIEVWLPLALSFASIMTTIAILFLLAKWGVALADGAKRKPKSIPT